LVLITMPITSALLSAGTRDRSSNLRSFFQLQVLRRDLRDHGTQPRHLRFPTCFHITLARQTLGILPQRTGRVALRHRPPAIQYGRRQTVAPAHLAHRCPGLLRFPQNLQRLFRRKLSILAFAHPLRSVCRLPAAARSLAFQPLPFVRKSMKLHRSRRGSLSSAGCGTAASSRIARPPAARAPAR